MSRLKILLLQFRLNLVQNLFFIAECVLVFLVVNSGISTLLYSGYLERYADFDLDTVFFLSGAVSRNAAGSEPEQFEQMVEEIRSVTGVAGVGYYANESFLSGENEELLVSAFVLNSDMLRVKYPLSQGEWFGSQASPETQVILGGEIASLYEVGEIITLHKLETGQGRLQYIPVTARLIGKLREPAFAVDLNFSSSRPDYVNMFKPCENIVLTDDQTLISRNDIRYPAMSLLVFAEPGADLEQVRRELAAFGQPFDFREVDGYSREAAANRLARQLPAVGMLIAGVLFGVMGITYLGTYQNMKTLSVYYLYGMSRRGCALVNIILNTAMLGISLLFSVLLYYVPSVHDRLFRRALLGPQNLIFSLAFLAAAAGLSLAASCRFSRKSPVAALRRFE